MLSMPWLQNILYIIAFLFLCREGIKRLKDRVFSVGRLAVNSGILLLLSVESLVNDLGLLIGHLSLFLSGLCIITFLAFKNMHLSILIVCPSSKRIVLAGSAFPLVMYLLIFGIKYICTTLLPVSVTLSQNSILFAILSLLYGGICGGFMGQYLLMHYQIYQASAIPLHRSEQ